jgi:hypothetical protein
MALIALANVALMIFDLSYFPFRDLYLRFLPEFTSWYGETFKGIAPHWSCLQYLILNPVWLPPIPQGECHRTSGSATPTPLQIGLDGIGGMRFGFGLIPDP